MKKHIKGSEEIFGMVTIGRHVKPNFTVAVAPDVNNIGDCYFKYYNSENYEAATYVTRLDFRKHEKVIRKNQDGKKEWELNSNDRKAVCEYLDEISRHGVSFRATNWDYTLFSWNNELGFLEEDFSDKFSSLFEAFVNGFFDTDKNLKNPGYVPSTLERPDYTQLSEEIFGMARIGYIGAELEVYVNADDSGNIPHFHLRGSTGGEKFHACIKITSPEYFPHEGEEDVLNSSMINALDIFMRSKVQIKRYADKFDNNWQLTCFLWELNNSDTNIPDDATMPDYRKLK